ncbi:pre-piRNA 3'-exonuclease trimmer [Bicyclus anynana]|uniref:Pre-piRNA 3'-exonuclease trimmer n=1 Tax=Bicyclus anynana TaxID=110368 RepID=A0ABM3LEB4_BICAN|nr:pre-piRNA 3'-exonuclease trimmer [Bicyclus anynana]XP_052737404.1 pre-piRNA 3'-exonuclease trimmer [Bicyclus anynana]
MEITRKNFSEQLENITKNLKRSCFVGFDAEFTAILSGDCFKHRLFDTNKERYDLIKNEVSKMIMTQVGLTMFQYDREQDSYIAVGYTFHLCPQVVADIDQSFIFQASTLQFLCRHNFNFNKFTYDGLPYLSKAEEAYLQQQLKHKTLLGNLIQKLTIEDERELQKYCSEVSKWLIDNDEETIYLDVQNPLMRYIVHSEIRNRFPDVLTTDSLGNSNKVLIYRDKYVEGANSAPTAILEENLMSYLLGFSKIINLLAAHQKPIIGHNNFLDLVLLHNQFIGPLPNKYCVFKKNINNLFPIIFDTKYISFEMAKKLSYDEVWKSNALQDLYEFFSEGKCRKLQKGVNFIKLSTPFDVKQSYHEAGWDSYCSGYCFIRMGHWAACENRGKYRLVGPSEKLGALAPYCNKVNVIRGAVPFMNLVDVDPPRHRPELLHIKSTKERIINVGKVTSALASFGSIDVKPYGKRTALIAANSQHTADKILKQFKNDAEYRIAKFNVIRHSPTGRMAIWGGALITGSLLLYLLHKRVNK